MDETNIDRAAMERLAKALVFILGDDHPTTLTSISTMGRLLKKMGELDAALPYFREVLEARRRVLGDDHPHTLSSINDMDALLSEMDKLNEAEATELMDEE